MTEGNDIATTVQPQLSFAQQFAQQMAKAKIERQEREAQYSSIPVGEFTLKGTVHSKEYTRKDGANSATLIEVRKKLPVVFYDQDQPVLIDMDLTIWLKAKVSQAYQDRDFLLLQDKSSGRFFAILN